jgi:hypothetical protein
MAANRSTRFAVALREPVRVRRNRTIPRAANETATRFLWSDAIFGMDRTPTHGYEATRGGGICRAGAGSEQFNVSAHKHAAPAARRNASHLGGP